MNGIESVRDMARFNTLREREEQVSDRVNGGPRPGFGEMVRNTLESFDNRGSRGSEDTRLRNSCIEMESLFISRMLKEMRKSIPKNEWLHGGFAEEVFTDMLYDEYALSISQNSNLGLAGQLYEEMSRNRG